MTTDDTASVTDTSAATDTAATQSVDEQIGTSAEAPISQTQENGEAASATAPVAVTATATDALATIKAQTPDGHEDHGVIAKIEADLAEAEAWIKAWFAAHA